MSVKSDFADVAQPCIHGYTYLVIYRVFVKPLTLVLIKVDDRSRWTHYVDRDDDGIGSLR